MMILLVEKELEDLVQQENKGSDFITQKYLTVNDIRQTFGCSKNKAYKIINIKGFPKLKIGKNYYIDQEAFLKWQKENMNTTICLS